MVGEHSLSKPWTRLIGFLLALGFAFLTTSASAIGAEDPAPAAASASSAKDAAGPGAASGVALASPAAAATPAPAAETEAAAAGTEPELPPGYVDNSTCVRCHKVEGPNFRKTMMGHLMMGKPRDQQERLGCQSCHGAGREHMRHPHKPASGFLSFRPAPAESAEVQNERCLECHQTGERAFWKASTHAFRGLRCVDCHIVMCPVTASEQPDPQIKKSPLSLNFVNPFVVTRNETQVCLRCHLKQKMEINLPSHMPLREGLMVCSDCHNPHGGPYQKQLKAATVNEVCYRCHAEKRGPFLWLHAPVMMNCLDCHTPHGSVNLHMLAIRPPLLCQRCHIGMDHASSPQRPFSVFVFNQSCTNCHSQIHGSNSPGGRLFTR